MQVEVTIKYGGHYASLTGCPQESIAVDDHVTAACEQVQRHVRQRYQICPPYILLVGNQHMIGACKKRQNQPIRQGEIFQLLPFVSGG
ncbi:MAG: hypothetical protein Q4C72_04380 [Eubacteriales bacterium]|nr:hypothetical protein [Eubacteriales bacterium]